MVEYSQNCLFAIDHLRNREGRCMIPECIYGLLRDYLKVKLAFPIPLLLRVTKYQTFFEQNLATIQLIQSNSPTKHQPKMCVYERRIYNPCQHVRRQWVATHMGFERNPWACPYASQNDIQVPFPCSSTCTRVWVHPRDRARMYGRRDRR